MEQPNPTDVVANNGRAGDNGTQERGSTPPQRTGKSSSAGRKSKSASQWWALGVALAVALVAVVAYGVAIGSRTLLIVEVLVAMAAATIGSGLGFLFGIPRFLTSDRTAEGAGPSGDKSGTAPTAERASWQYQPSTNLEQVSDWLTKILIGVGLVQLGEIASKLEKIGSIVAQPFGQAVPSAAVFTEIVIIVFVPLGFLAAYLWTRTSYAEILALSDSAVADALQKLNRRQSELEDLQSELEKVQKQTETQSKGVRKELASLVMSKAGFAGTPTATVTTVGDDALDVRGRTLRTSENWPEALRRKVEQFASEEYDWESDPNAKYFSEYDDKANGRILRAEIVQSREYALDVRLTVRCTDLATPLEGEVTFLLHPTFTPKTVKVNANGREASTEIVAAEWFTVVAIADEGRTVLRLPLKNLAGAPSWFTEG